MPLGSVLTFPCLLFISDKREINASYFVNESSGNQQRTVTRIWREIPGTVCDQFSQCPEECERTYVVVVIVFRSFYRNILIFLTSAAQFWYILWTRMFSDVRFNLVSPLFLYRPPANQKLPRQSIMCVWQIPMLVNSCHVKLVVESERREKPSGEVSIFISLALSSSQGDQCQYG